MGKVLGGVALVVPLAALYVCSGSVPESLDPSPFPSSWTGFSINEAEFTSSNYMLRLLQFAKAAAVGDFRPSYAQWFADNTEGDPNIGVKFGGNTKMFYSWVDCKEKLSSI